MNQLDSDKLERHGGHGGHARGGDSSWRFTNNGELWHAVQWNGGATVSHERGGAPVTTAAMARQNAVLPGFDRWCWWLKEVEVMTK